MNYGWGALLLGGLGVNEAYKRYKKGENIFGPKRIAFAESNDGILLPTIASAIIFTMVARVLEYPISKYVVEKRKKEILDKIDTQEIYTDGVGRKYYLTSLNPELEKEVRDALQDISVSESLRKDILIIGKKQQIEYKKGEMKNAAAVFTQPGLFFNTPFAIVVDIDCAKEISPSQTRYNLLHEAGHVLTMPRLLFSDDELCEVTAEVCAVHALAKQGEKDLELKELGLADRPDPYFTAIEAIYYWKKLEKEKNNAAFDPIAYAKQIVAARKDPGYKQQIAEELPKMLGVVF
jgi:hypothetical protein